MNIQSIVVIGAGTMGSGIAQWFAQQGTTVELVDASDGQLQRALRDVHLSWDKLVEKKKLDAGAVAGFKLNFHVKGLEAVSRNADLVIEAIVENLEIKKDLFRNLDAYFDAGTILASNTSSFPITLLAEAVSPERRSRFLGLHFFNPATLMRLVEVISAEQTDKPLSQDLYAWFEAHGKMPALSKDSPGFIVNRVARNFYGEPLRIADTDDQTKLKEIDRILREVGGFKMGPFELMDLIGIDVNYSVTCSVWDAYNKEPRFAPHRLQKQLVDEQRFGRKSKRGFFTYD